MTKPTQADIQLLQQVLSTGDKLAISTALDGAADVRIINYIWYPEEPDAIYFSSVRGTPALAKYAAGADVAFITVPHDGTPNNPFVRSNSMTVAPANREMSELLPRYLETVPNYQRTWDAIGPKLVAYRIQLHNVHVDAGLGNPKVDLSF